MKKRVRLLIVCILALSLAFVLAACGGNKPKVTVDENGLATWEAMEGATGYEIEFVYEVNGTPVNDGAEVIQATSVQIPEGFCLHIRAVYEDGSYSNTCTTDYYGEKYVVEGDDYEGPAPEIPQVLVDENGLATWEPIEGAIAYEVKYVKDDREIVDIKEFKDIPEEYYYGLRLGEQRRNVNNEGDFKDLNSWTEYVNRLISRKK